MADSLLRRPRRTQAALDLRIPGRKPSGPVEVSHLKRVRAPTFCWMPGQRDRHDLVCGRVGNWTVWTGSVGTAYNARHKKGFDFPSSSSGNEGACVEWDTTDLQSDDFTALVVLDFQGGGYAGYAGIFSGGYSATVSQRSWIIIKDKDISDLGTNKWKFTAYNTSQAGFGVSSSAEAATGLVTLVVRKRGTELALWVAGDKTTDNSFTGVLQSSTDPARVGALFSDHTWSGAVEGPVYLAAYWSQALPDTTCNTLHYRQYSFLQPIGPQWLPISTGAPPVTTIPPFLQHYRNQGMI